MDKQAIHLKIENNRKLIERALSADLSPVLLKQIVNELSKKNEILIKRLNE